VRLSDGPLGHYAKATLPCTFWVGSAEPAHTFWVGSAEPAHTFWVGSAEPAHTENADFISAGGFAPSLGASKRCVLQAFAMQMRV